MQKGFFEIRHHYIKLSEISDIIENLTKSSGTSHLNIISYNNDLIILYKSIRENIII